MADGTFQDRLRLIMGRRSVNAFAKECGFAESAIRQYLRGAFPRLDNAVTIARVGGCSLDWLATGELPEGLKRARDVDADLLGGVIGAVRGLYSELKIDLADADLARLSAEKYDEIAKASEDAGERRAMVKLIVSQLRRELQDGKGGKV